MGSISWSASWNASTAEGSTRVGFAGVRRDGYERRVNDAALKREGWRTLVLVLSFVESFGTILLERGIYFFTHERLHYSDTQNLALAAGFGATYGAGAWVSH